MNREQTEAIERVRCYGLTDGQVAILKGLEAWFDENPEPPSGLDAIAELAGVSRGLVGISLPALEALDYVLVHRHRNGRVKKRGVILMMALGEENL